MTINKVRTLIFQSFWLSAFSLIFGSFASADQNDPKLDDLFSALQASTSQVKAAKLENEIWTRWNSHPTDQQANKQMSAASDLMNTGKLDAAETLFSHVINRHPNFSEAWNKRATVRFFLGNNKGSTADILQVIKLEPRHFGALSGLGMIHVQAGNMQGALQAYSAAQKMNPYLPQIDIIIDNLGQTLNGRAL